EITMDIDGKQEKVIIKALQRHPNKVKLIHADFLRV
ncbi:50S ribosomal protein L25, partial [Francisella tularensis subsp. holarctica]|nr:50S ribosomal protein L25 [Francisella tularensis subsp. holarctica]